MNSLAPSDGDLTGAKLTIARATWLVLVIVSLVLVFVAIPLRYSQLISLSGSALPEGWTQELFRSALYEAGISAGFFAAYVISLEVMVALVASAIAIIIFWRRSRSWSALLISLWLVTFATNIGTTSALLDTNRVMTGLVHTLDQIGWALLIPLVFLTFPNGRFVPGWTRRLGFAWIVLALVILINDLVSIGQDGSIPTYTSPLFIIWVGIWIMGILAQIYRFRRVSDPIQRQQTKWVIYGMFGTVLTILTILLINFIFPSFEEPGPWGVIYGEIIIRTAISLGFLLVPLSIGIAMLRFRLWDVEILIRRTLVYGILTALLILIYVGTVVLLQSIFGAFSGQRSPAVIVVSTLVIAALFVPMRRRVQDIIDRRFYRHKYDAARMLTRFAAKARDEVELEALTIEIVKVVQETMQPENVSLWLRKSHREKNLGIRDRHS